jgi:hypothetical protein
LVGLTSLISRDAPMPPKLNRRRPKRLQVLQSPVLACPPLAQVSSQFYESRVALGLFPPLPGENLVDLGEHPQESRP